MHARIGALLVALTLAVTGLATAQETTSGSIAGQVLDAQGLGVPGATVTITSEQGTKDYVTDAEGRFFAPFLQPGVYDARVELSGFAPIEQRMIQVRLGQRVTLTDLTMRVGGLTETVQVQASAPVVDITSTTAGGVLTATCWDRCPSAATSPTRCTWCLASATAAASARRIPRSPAPAGWRTPTSSTASTLPTPASVASALIRSPLGHSAPASRRSSFVRRR